MTAGPDTESIVRVLMDVPGLCVWSEDGIETAVWELGKDGRALPGADPTEHGCVLMFEPRPLAAGMMAAEVMTVETVASICEYGKEFAAEARATAWRSSRT